MSKRDITLFEGCEQAWNQALESAGATLNDLSFVETHDCFTIAELLEYEAMGLTKRGQGARATAEGWTEKDGRLPVNRSEEHTSELQSLMRISYAVFCLKKKNQIK